MTTLSEKFKFYNTHDADAVAADIRTGKSAYVNGGKVAGTYTPFSNETLLHWVPGLAGAQSGIVPDENTGAMYMRSDVSMNTATGTWNINALLGIARATTGEITWQLPARPAGSYREYRWQAQSVGRGSQWQQLRLLFNRLNGSNYWCVRMMDEGASSSDWQTQHLSVISGAEGNWGTSIDPSPTYFIDNGTVFSWILRDCGGLFHWCCLVSNIDTATSTSYAFTGGQAYYNASRSLVSEVGAGIRSDSSVIYLKYLQIEDVVDDA